MICESTSPNWNQDFVIELEGAQNLRILLYEDHPRQGTLIRAKTTIEVLYKLVQEIAFVWCSDLIMTFYF